ncbi:MAG: hypothetical protein R3E09_14390 [Novosphingobium sp.]
MALEAEAISRIDALIEALGGEGDAHTFEQALVRLLPGIACRHCDASDVLEEPFRQAAGVDLHMLDASAHCIRVTGDPAEATALLLASRVPA